MPSTPTLVQIGDGRAIGEKVGQTGRGEGVGVVPGAMDRNRSDCNEVAVEGRGDLPYALHQFAVEQPQSAVRGPPLTPQVLIAFAFWRTVPFDQAMRT